MISLSCHVIGIKKHDTLLYEMGMKEKDHEVYFLDKKYPVEESDHYCKVK